MKKCNLISVSLLFAITSVFSQSGNFDPTFGSAGKTYANILPLNGSNEAAYAVAVQPDGKILIAGTTQAPSAIYRLNTDGTPDISFDGDGMAWCFGIKVSSIAVQPDGKIIIGGGDEDFVIARFNSNGSTDNSFDDDGRVIMPIGPSYERITALALQSDGKIVAAGVINNGSDDDIAVARYNPDGSADYSFGTNGIVITPIGTGSTAYDQANAVTIQPDGKIIVAGYSYTDFAVVRYNTDGSQDISFDDDGILITDFGSSDDQANSIALQDDGKIVVAGATWDANTGFDFALARYHANGIPDSSFDADGRLSTDFNSIDRATSVAIQSDGRIVAVGYNENYVLARYNTDGSLDNSFDGDGRVIADIHSSYDRANAMALQTDGKIVATGRSENGIRNDFSVARFNTDGSFDNSFDSDGRLLVLTPSSEDHATSIAVQHDGKILVGGYTNRNINMAANMDFALARFNADGTPDNSFDGDGKLATAIGSSNDIINAVAVQVDGRIVVAGASRRASSIYYDFALARYLPDGSPDNSFDGDGKLVFSPGAFNNVILGMAIQPDGKIVAAGYSENGSNADFALVRFNSDGSPDNSFDGDGIVTTAFGTTDDLGNALAIQPDGKIVIAGYTGIGFDVDFALARFNADGSPDITFDTDGVLVTDIDASIDRAYALTIQPDGKIIATGHTESATFSGIAVVRYNSDGSGDTSFDADGKVTTGVGLSGAAFSVTVQGDGKILVAGDSDNGSHLDFALVRYLADGSLDNMFNGDGQSFLSLDAGTSEHLSAMKLVGDRIYMTGETVTAGGYDFVLAAALAGPVNSTLPLRFVDFSGQLIDNNALLNWRTENEVNTLEFIIERSLDGRGYTTAGTVPANDNAGTSNYSFTDPDVASRAMSSVQYRLKQTDMDGKFTYSRVVAFPVGKNKNSFLFYPNPVISEASLSVSLEKPAKLVCRIIDNTGRTVRSQQWDLPAAGVSLTVNVNGLPPGIYFVELAGDGIEYKKRFLKR